MQRIGRARGSGNRAAPSADPTPSRPKNGLYRGGSDL